MYELVSVSVYVCVRTMSVGGALPTLGTCDKGTPKADLTSRAGGSSSTSDCSVTFVRMCVCVCVCVYVCVCSVCV